MFSWLVVWFGSDLAGSCVLTQSVDPSQVEAGWVGWLAGWLAGWLVCWFGSDTLGKRGPSPVVAESGHLSIRAKLTHVGLVGWLVGWSVGWLVGWLAGSCALTHSVNPSQVEWGWVGWLAGWLVGWLAGWLVWVRPGWVVWFDTICQSEPS